MNNILIVTTNTFLIADKIPTGVWYEEFAIPYLKFKEAGCEILIASPKGGKSPVDAKSLKNESTEILSLLENTCILDEINPKNFDCIFIPGGHGCVFDLPYNKNLAYIIESMINNQKIISAVCHGVCALIGAKNSNEEAYVKKKTLTGFSNAEEEESKMSEYMPFLLEDELKKLGANYVKKSPWVSFVVEDDCLLTGQNQNSSAELASKIVSKLK